MSLAGRVAIVTGAGRGLGRIYARTLAQEGAKVVVNDIGGSMEGGGVAKKVANDVVSEIIASGGTAVANYDSVIDGEQVVNTALNEFGTVDIIVNNAGNLRDKSFHKMGGDDWKKVIETHLGGAFSVTSAAWPHMREANYGRIVNITSISGLYGSFGQANYATAKMGMVGFTKTLAKEGAKRNIKVNAVAPGAGSRMSETILPPEAVERWRPEHVAPLVAHLCSEQINESGAIFEAGGGWFSQVKLVRTPGVFFPIGGAGPTAPAAGEEGHISVEDVANRWADITDWSQGAEDADIAKVLDSPQLYQILEDTPPK